MWATFKEYSADQYLAVTEADKWSSRLPARHILFIFDSCFSGHGWNLGFIPKEGSPNSTLDLINTVSGKSSRYVITAGSGKERAYQIEVARKQGYSVFTHEFIKVLRNNPAYSQQGFVLLDQAFGSARVGVAVFTGPSGLKMNPQKFDLRRSEDDTGEFVFVNAKIKGAILPQFVKDQFEFISKVAARSTIRMPRKISSVGSMFAQPVNNNADGANATATGDFNGDGKLDLISVSPKTGNIDVWLGRGDGTFEYTRSYPSGDIPYSPVVSDFNRDGILDVAVSNVSWDNKKPDVAVFLGNGDGTFRGPYIAQAGKEPTILVTADFNNDGTPDLAVGNRSDNTVSVLIGKGDGTFQEPVTYKVGGNAYSVAVGDFNMDGMSDLAVGTTGQTGLSILLGKGDGSFADAKNYLISPSDTIGWGTYSIAVADFNGDNKPDLALTSFSNNTVGVLLGNGDGTFQDVTPYKVADGPFHVVAVDLGGSGILDLVSANNSNTVSVLMGIGDGTFSNAQNYPAGYSPCNIAVGDFNRDGLLDLAIANRGDGSISILLNTSKKATLMLTADPNPSAGGPPVTFTADVASNEGDAEGMVEFSSDGNILGTKAVAGGSASVTTRALAPGTHNVIASYMTKGTTSQKSATLTQVVK